MKKKKELDVNELLNVLETSEDSQDIQEITPINDKEQDFLDFIEHFNIQTGKHKIKKTQLYKLYKNWSEHPIEKFTFNNYLYKFLPHKINTNIGLNYDVIKLNEDLKRLLFAQQKRRYKFFSRHFNSFINFYNIETGKKPISLECLYYIYENWKKKNKIKRSINPVTFKELCDLHFNYIYNEKRKKFYYIKNYPKGFSYEEIKKNS